MSELGVLLELARTLPEQGAVDSASLVTLLSGLKEVVVAMAAAIVAISAIVGLGIWKNQLKGRAEYELARRFLRAGYGVRNAIRAVRTPIILRSEEREALRQQRVPEEEIEDRRSQGDGESAVYEERWKIVWGAMSDLKVETVEAEVLWGGPAEECLSALYGCVGKLRTSIPRYLDEKRGAGPMSIPLKEWRDLQATVFEVSRDPEEDPFTQRVQAAVGQLEDFVKPYLKF